MEDFLLSAYQFGKLVSFRRRSEHYEHWISDHAAGKVDIIDNRAKAVPCYQAGYISEVNPAAPALGSKTAFSNMRRYSCDTLGQVQARVRSNPDIRPSPNRLHMTQRSKPVPTVPPR